MPRPKRYRDVKSLNTKMRRSDGIEAKLRQSKNTPRRSGDRDVRDCDYNPDVDTSHPWNYISGQIWPEYSSYASYSSVTQALLARHLWLWT